MDYDKTNYKFINKYKSDQEKLSPEEFKELIETKLISEKNITQEMAKQEASAIILGKRLVENGDYAILKLSSGETRKVNSTCTGTIGTVSNPDQKNVKIGKAGRNRWRGKRPQTRGVAMNPVDHPHGGGEGKTSGGRSPVSPWGQSAKGLKTRRPKRSDKLIITRRKKRKR